MNAATERKTAAIKAAHAQVNYMFKHGSLTITSAASVVSGLRSVVKSAKWRNAVELWATFIVEETGAFDDAISTHEGMLKISYWAYNQGAVYFCGEVF